MSCHGAASENGAAGAAGGGVALVGHPNVGKSVLFQRLTGRYAVVSNYPGTTVEVTRGTARFGDARASVIDTPGIIAFPPRSEDERIAARVLLDEELHAVVQVGDAKNARRTLLLAVQLAELGLPLVLVLNMMDEAEAHGVRIDHELLARELDVRVVLAVATRGTGVDDLVASIGDAARPAFRIDYPGAVEAGVAALAPDLPDSPLDPRALALLWLGGDSTTEEWVAERAAAGGCGSCGGGLDRLRATRARVQEAFGDPLSTVLQRARLARVDGIVAAAVRDASQGQRGLAARLAALCTHPLLGWPVLLAVLYAMYWFVGRLGAGTLVGLVENDLFGRWINPAVVRAVRWAIPWDLGADFLVGPYGLWTMAVMYAFALILPIVTTFFLAFSVLEDSGYLPRLTVVSNRLFKALGLNGKAALPMVLGLGCVTMATLTTRILESRRDRLLVILLLALAVPCSAQLGVVLGMLGSVSFVAAVIWGAVILLVLLAVGALAARLVPGERTTLLVEMPPLRLPVLSNVVVKTVSRLEWYLKEVVPLFLAGTAALFVLDRTGALPAILDGTRWLVTGWLRLPSEASEAFILGFLRRDFGATGLFLMRGQGRLTDLQVLVSMVTITLFIPCIASVLMIARERGARTAAGMTILIFPLAFLIGGLLSRTLSLAGWGA